MKEDKKWYSYFKEIKKIWISLVQQLKFIKMLSKKPPYDISIWYIYLYDLYRIYIIILNKNKYSFTFIYYYIKAKIIWFVRFRGIHKIRIEIIYIIIYEI